MQVLLLIATVVTLTTGATVDPSLKAKLEAGKSVDLNIVLDSVSDIFTSPALLKMEKESRIASMIATATEKTSKDQKPFLELLEKSGKSTKDIKTFWISNEIFVKDADISTLQSILTIPGNYLVREPIEVNLVEPFHPRNATESEVKANRAENWNIRIIRGDVAHLITKGEGTVVGVIDTGVYGLHFALNNNYARAWLDPIYGDPEPTDENGHGTHIIGTAVGMTNGIGVAPGARWIACRGLNHIGTGTNEHLLECAQFMVTAEPRPNVVSNSWGGAAGNNFFDSAIDAWRAAGIVPVFAVGGSGTGCGNVGSPGDNPKVVSVGATDNNDAITSFTSRGPGQAESIKPDLCAPGASVLSASNSAPDLYATMSGTSTSVPHVTGTVALIAAYDSSLTVDQIIGRLQTTASCISLPEGEVLCGDLGPDCPNMACGYGRLDAAASCCGV